MPGGRGFELFFARGMGNSPIKKIAREFCPGGWSGLELTDTLNPHISHWHGNLVAMATTV